MSTTKILFMILGFTCASFLHGQDLTTEQKEQLEYKVSVFMSNDKELQELWYEDRMDKMKLQGKLREDYLKMVKYHALKMEQLKGEKSKSSADQMKAKLQERVRLMEVDVKDVLDQNQLEIHQKTWNAIINAVILREGLNVK
ncbi:hypothetical protein FGM00_11090 [Aggregatimonas sangjinii]|uniref:Uncharacterized protein n=1 Tax=Aggregatimonas sangjinii TaxID=2583587 RepID=A0A5B7SUP9_9FLAO|nr:hypothetical protein [Aggregatimonas sangjinii]QCX00621.1 hypothetical protein FGM00_11090 [Aggregatimonas sangjinii]